MADSIEHEGIVKAVEGDKVQVLIVQTSACAACHAKSACMAADSSEKLIEAQPLTPMQTDDHVRVFAQRRLGLKAVLLAFVIPFVIVIFLVAVFAHVLQSEALGGTLALASLIPYYIVLSFFKDTLKKQFQFYAEKIESCQATA